MTAPSQGDVAVTLGRVAFAFFHLRTAVLDAIRELEAGHRPEWASEKAKASGKEPLWCTTCGAADGSWPCLAAEVAGDLKRALEAVEASDG